MEGAPFHKPRWSAFSYQPSAFLSWLTTESRKLFEGYVGDKVLCAFFVEFGEWWADVAPLFVSGLAGHESLEGRNHGVRFDESTYLCQALLQGFRIVVIPRGVCVVDAAGQAGGYVDCCGDTTCAAAT